MGSRVAEELATPFDPRHAPLVRAVLIHATDNAAFTLVAHHAIADAMSLAYTVRDTLRALSGAVLEPLPSTPSLEEMLWVDGDDIESAVDGSLCWTHTSHTPRDGLLEVGRSLDRSLLGSTRESCLCRLRARRRCTRARRQWREIGKASGINRPPGRSPL